MADNIEIDEEIDDEDSGEGKENKIFCANCIHCKLVTAHAIADGDDEAKTCPDRYVLRVRCDAGKWKKKMGEEKFYKYCTIGRRSVEECDAYDEMGELHDFLRDLRHTLASKDEAYTLTPGQGFQAL
jgi:hypothetical protein